MNKSESIANLTAALIRARQKFEPIVKTKEARIEGGKANFSFKYAPLEEVLHKITPALNEEGLMLTQGVVGFCLETSLFHTSGEWMTYSEEMPHTFASPRAFGSELSYHKRYAIGSLLGTTAEEDDDGQIAERELTRKTKSGSAPSGSAAELMQDSFNKQTPEEQEYLRGIAANVVALLEEGRNGEAYDYLENKRLDEVEKPAVWGLLTSTQRTTIKKTGAQKRKLETPQA